MTLGEEDAAKKIQAIARGWYVRVKILPRLQECYNHELVEMLRQQVWDLELVVTAMKGQLEQQGKILAILYEKMSNRQTIEEIGFETYPLPSMFDPEEE